MAWVGDNWIYTNRDIKRAISSAIVFGETGSDARIDLYLARTALGLSLKECYLNIKAIKNWLNGRRSATDLEIIKLDSAPNSPK
jgi:hypothetical protein